MGDAWSLFHEFLSNSELASVPSFQPPSDGPLLTGDEWADDLEKKVWEASSDEEIKKILEDLGKEVGIKNG